MTAAKTTPRKRPVRKVKPVTPSPRHPVTPSLPVPALSALETGRRRAKAGGWLDLVRTASDEEALRAGCYYDPARAAHVEEFARRYIRNTLGRWAGEPFAFLPWQRDQIIRPLFGWVRPDGRRRFRYAFVFVPKKNGKSALCSLLALYTLVADGEPRAEVYATAVDRQQAAIVYAESREMVKASPTLRDRIEVIESTKTLLYRGSFFRALSGEDDSSEGKNAHCVISDELHAWRTPKARRLWGSLFYAGVARSQPLSIVITTAGDDEEDALWFEEHQKAKEILAGERVNVRRLAVIFGATEAEAKGDGWTDPAVHRKANPSYGAIIDPEEMTAACESARRSPREKKLFLRYRLNRPTSSLSAWLPPDAWDRCASPPVLEPGDPVYVGLDLASTSDFCALVVVVRKPGPEGGGRRGTGDGEEEAISQEMPIMEPPAPDPRAPSPVPVPDNDDHYHVLPFLFLPEARVEQRIREGKLQYREWADAGLIEVTPGDVTDFRVVEEKIVWVSQTWQLVELAYDPWNAMDLALRLKDQHAITVVECRQTLANLTHPSKKLERLVRRGQVCHGGHPVLRWMALHCRVYADANANVRPVKPKDGAVDQDKKIDGIVAAIMAVGRAMLAAGNAASHYETHLLGSV